MRRPMQIDMVVTLINTLGDEVGELELDSVRLVPAGTETVSPDLVGQMSNLLDRVIGALTELDLEPALDPLGLRIVLSRALLNAGPGGVSIPVPIRPLNSGVSAWDVPKHSPAAAQGTGPAEDLESLFRLNPQSEPVLERGPRPPEPPLVGGGPSPSNGVDAAEPIVPEPLDHWTVLGDLWEMDELDGDEGGWQ